MTVGINDAQKVITKYSRERGTEAFHRCHGRGGREALFSTLAQLLFWHGCSVARLFHHVLDCMMMYMRTCCSQLRDRGSAGVIRGQLGLKYRKL